MFFIEKMKDIDITKVDMTGKWEQLLDKVRNGELPVEQAEDIIEAPADETPAEAAAPKKGGRKKKTETAE